MMSSEERGQLHVLILQALRAKADLGRTEDALLNDARMGGHDLGLQELRVELRQLEQKTWIDRLNVDLGPRRWRLAPLGESALRTSGL